MSVLEKMKELIGSEENNFSLLMTELSLLVEKLDCPYTKGFFWAVRLMMEGRSIEEKKEILKKYKEIYLTLE